jgi:hypothetical protein
MVRSRWIVPRLRGLHSVSDGLQYGPTSPFIRHSNLRRDASFHELAIPLFKHQK